MRALLYLLTLTLFCFLKNGFCVINIEEFIKNKDAMDLVEKYHNNQINTQKDLLQKLDNIRVKLCSSTLTNYLKEIKAAGGGYRKNAFEQFKNDPHAMSLVEQFNNKQITDTELSEALKQINHKMSIKSMHLYVARLNHEKNGGGTPNLPNQSQSTEMWDFSNPTKDFSKGWNSDNWSLSSITGSAPHYGDVMPYQQVPPMHGTSAFPNQPFNQSAPLNSSTNFVPSQTEKDSLDWSGGNSQDNEGDLELMLNTRKPSSAKKGKKPRN